MKPLIIMIVALSFIGCHNRVETGSWILKDSIYRYTDSMSTVKMIKDFDLRYGKDYKILSIDSRDDVIICEPKIKGE